MARSIWKGAISFGLVHVPVALVSATSSENIDFDWLDNRTMDPVGYKRVNKATGKEVSKENIVKGIQYEKGKYILLSEEEIKSAHPKSTQTIDIFSFVENTDIPLAHIDTPYFLAPEKRGEKVYALLRESLAETGTVGLASIIIHTKQHLAAVMPIGSALVVILLRWPNEVRSEQSLELTSATTNAELSKAEKDMAKRLIQDMKGKWSPAEYKDTFQEKIMALVDKKVSEGQVEDVETDAGDAPRKSADIIDLTELLKRSLGGNKKSSSSVDDNPSKPATKKSTPSKSTKEKSVAKIRSGSVSTKRTTEKSTESKPKKSTKNTTGK